MVVMEIHIIKRKKTLLESFFVYPDFLRITPANFEDEMAAVNDILFVYEG